MFLVYEKNYFGCGDIDVIDEEKMKLHTTKESAKSYMHKRKEEFIADKDNNFTFMPDESNENCFLFADGYNEADGSRKGYFQICLTELAVEDSTAAEYNYRPIYNVGVDIDDEFNEFATCSDIKAAEKAKSLLEKAGWANLQIKKSNLCLDTIMIDDMLYHLRSESVKGINLIPMDAVIKDSYVLMPCMNVFNDKISFWISKNGNTKALYCFSVKNYEIAEYEYQLKNINQYIKMYQDSEY